MDYITSTELRTKTSELIKALSSGKTVKLLHRSKKVAILLGSNPANESKVEEPKPFNPELFLEDSKDLDFGPMSIEEIDHHYRQAMEKKHGKRVS